MENPTSPSLPGSRPLSPTASGIAGLFATPAVKIGSIAVLMLFMLIPLHYISNVVWERQLRQQQVLSDFRASWGPSQFLLGPILVVPYQKEADKPQRFLHIAASQLNVITRLAPETRKRGLFHAIVYGADVSLKGNFVLPRELIASVATGDLQWQNSFIAMRVTDMSGVSSLASLNWSGQPLAWEACADDDYLNCRNEPLVVAQLHWNGAPTFDQPIAFDTALNLRGTERFGIVPTGRAIAMKISAPWSTPSFFGTLLPSHDTVSDTGFEAEWGTSSNAAISRWIWSSGWALEGNADWKTGSGAPNQIGVELLEPVPTYQMVERSSKYALLFLALSFVTYFLFEMISRSRIHLIQYGLLGFSISLFALLLVSFSEPIGFGLGYLIATVLVLAQASIFTLSTTRQPRLAVIFAAILGSLFAFLYIVLRLESFSLLAGSVALFVALSIVMAVSRRVDWFGVQLTSPGAQPAARPSSPA